MNKLILIALAASIGLVCGPIQASNETIERYEVKDESYRGRTRRLAPESVVIQDVRDYSYRGRQRRL
jgi:hypothetical protein